MIVNELIFDHDGGVDDFQSLIYLLMNDENKRLSTILIVPGDSFIHNAVETTLKLLNLFQRRDIVVAESDCYGVHQFPDRFRAPPKIINYLPQLINEPMDRDQLSSKKASCVLMDKLSETKENSIDILITGPCSNLTTALEMDGNLGKKIHRVVWMAGNINVKGNVERHDHDSSAEWNVFYDPISAHKLLRHNLNLELCPLDVTNKVPVNKEFLKRLSKISHPIANLSATMWATTVSALPTMNEKYFMWDVMSTVLFLQPNLFEMKNKSIDIIPNTQSAGKIIDGKYKIRYASDISPNKFYDFILSQYDGKEGKEFDRSN
ncbi:hypothetical protein SNEBB_005735 [Seison nebaliae]|nr:hypothetical protein SNEBB_005735 [Seison nebaliae]